MRTLGGTGNTNYPFATYTAATTNPLESYNLYNGNIARMSTTIYAGEVGQPNFIEKTPQIMAYQYDQLNRISTAKSASGYNTSLNLWLAKFEKNYKTNYSYDGNGNILSLNRNGHLNPAIMDSLSYSYYIGTNRLKRVVEKVDEIGSPYENDIKPSYIRDSHYVYSKIGNLIEDRREGFTVEWFVNGKIKSINRSGIYADISDLPDIEFQYDAMGNRISKLIKTRTGTILNKSNHWRKTYYVRDAQGNVMATYDRIWEGPTSPNNGSGIQYSQSDQLTVSEQHLYPSTPLRAGGSSRLGVRKANRWVARREFRIIGQIYDYKPTVTVTNVNPLVSQYETGRKKYELSNHLGNVLAVISDNVWAEVDTEDQVKWFTPDIVAVKDYYPFGMEMPGRNYSSEGYRYGFNGMEKDGEIKGSGNHVDFGARGYDPRLGRWLSVDPLQMKYPRINPYNAIDNNPILFIDPDGRRIVIYYEENGKEMTHVYTGRVADFYNGDNQFLKDFYQAVNFISYNGMDVNSTISDAISSLMDVEIFQNNPKNNPIFTNPLAQGWFLHNDGKPDSLKLVWDSRKGAVFPQWKNENWIMNALFGEEGSRSPAEVLLHELGHFVSYQLDPQQHLIDMATPIINYDNKEEYDVIREVENPAADKLGGKRRNHHQGSFKEVDSPIERPKVK